MFQRCRLNAQPVLRGPGREAGGTGCVLWMPRLRPGSSSLNGGGGAGAAPHPFSLLVCLHHKYQIYVCLNKIVCAPRTFIYSLTLYSNIWIQA